MTYLEPSDLEPFATIDADKAQAMIDDAEAQASLAAPCLTSPDDLDDHQRAAVKAILRGAILRWNDSGSGAYQQQTTGPFSVSYDTRQTRRSLFWPSEIDQLQSICTAIAGGSGAAWSIDTGGSCTIRHDIACTLNFGGSYCSCGADLTLADPLYGYEP